MRVETCVWPLYGRKPRCKAPATEAVVISGIQFVRTCQPHKAPTRKWAKHDLARQQRAQEKYEQECQQLAIKAERVCLKRLRQGDGALGRYLLDMINFDRLDNEELLALANGSLPKEHKFG